MRRYGRAIANKASPRARAAICAEEKLNGSQSAESRFFVCAPRYSQVCLRDLIVFYGDGIFFLDCTIRFLRRHSLAASELSVSLCKLYTDSAFRYGNEILFTRVACDTTILNGMYILLREIK